jgi:hypothetical protein
MMNFRMVTVTTPATSRQLVPLARMKAEMELTNSVQDVLLGYKIDEVSSDIDNHCNRVLALETVTETFLGGSYGAAGVESGFYHDVGGGYLGHGEFLNLRREAHLRLSRRPVAAIASVTVDGVVFDPTMYLLDPETGWLFHIDTTGARIPWWPYMSVAIAYTGGYVLPAMTGTPGQTALPADLAKAAVALVKASWFARKRDPMERSHGEPGLGQTVYWVGGAPGTAGLPTDILATLERYRDLPY